MSTANAATQPLTPSCWKDVIIHQDDTSRLASEGILAKARFADDKSIDDCMDAALAVPEATFFMKTSSSPNPVIVQGAMECRSTSALSISKLYGIHQGLGNPADKCRINPENFFKKFQESEPLDFSSIAASLSSVAFHAAETVTDGPKVTDLRSAMFIPPIIANKVFELQDLTAGEMACQIMNLIRVETLGDSEEAPSTFAVDKEFHSLITWLYYFNDLENVDLDMIFEGSDLAVASKELHNRVLGPIRPPPGPATACSLVNPSASATSDQVVIQSAALQCEQNEYLKMIAGSMERSGSNRRGFDRLPKSVKNMILASLSKDGIVAATDISPAGREIFDARTDADAHIALKHAMDSAGLYYGELSAAQAKSISSGNWQWSGCNPSGISMLLFNPFDPCSTTSLEKTSMVLHLKTKFGMDSVSLKSLTETDVVLPTDAEGTIQRLTISKFIFSLFGDESLLERNLNYLIEMIRQNMKLFQQMVAKRGTFIAEFLCAVDSRIDSWFEECNRFPNNLGSVDTSIIDFYDIIQSLRRRNFSFVPLPPCIISLSQDNGADAHRYPGSDDANPRGQKKQKSGTVDNPNPRPEWMVRAGEIYGTIFGRPEDVHLRPRGLCLRWHMKGYCFADCKHKHCEPSADQVSALDTFIKKMRLRVANMTGASAA